MIVVQNARNGKSDIKLARMSILRPVTFKFVILERFESEKCKRIVRKGPANFHESRKKAQTSFTKLAKS